MVDQKFNLKGKTAIITGAAGLMGNQHAEALLENNAYVILSDTSVEGLAQAKNKLLKKYKQENFKTLVMDVTSISSIEQALHTILNDRIRVDILINNAAIDPKVSKTDNQIMSARLEDFSLERWELELKVGLTGAFLCSQIFGQKMASDNKGGVILNIASDLSVFAPDQRLYRNDSIDKKNQPVKPVTYSVIKTGLIGLTRYLATYWPENGVRSNALSPGGIYTDQSEEFVNRLEKLIPLGRMAKKDEYKSAIQFLCSDASTYMNGQNIVIDGGRSIW